MNAGPTRSSLDGVRTFAGLEEFGAFKNNNGLGFKAHSRCCSRISSASCGLNRLRLLRGPCGAKDEFLLAATAQNLRRLAKLRSMGGQMQPIAA